jgi:hypothetical protein
MAALTWHGPVTRTRGRHRPDSPVRRFLRRAHLKRNAGKSARNAALWVPLMAAVNWLAQPSPHVLALIATGSIYAVAAIAGGIWWT